MKLVLKKQKSWDRYKNTINLFYRNQMYPKYKHDKKAIKNIICL